MNFKSSLDAEKETLLAFIWLLPLIPMLAILVLFWCYGRFLWVLLLISLFWSILWGYIYRNSQTEICFEGDKITFQLKQKIYVASMADILYIEETVFLANPHKPHTYKIYMQPDVNIPFAYLFIRNKKIQKNLSTLFPGVHIKRNVVLN